ncbi:hypothetical protein D3C76_1563260 [compost metagenome]
MPATIEPPESRDDRLNPNKVLDIAFRSVQVDPASEMTMGKKQAFGNATLKLVERAIALVAASWALRPH